VGQGAALKLAMNQLIAGLTASFSLSLGLVRAEGIDADLFMGLLRSSALYAPTFDKKLNNYLAHDYGKANFPLKHLLKDVRLFRRVTESVAMDSALITTIEAACARAIGQGYAEQDYSAIYEALVPRR
jgi:3-hydroxyisobutyrate dehydrogenase